MNTRTNPSNGDGASVAQDLVFENLGIDSADLGADDDQTLGGEEQDTPQDLDDHDFGDDDDQGDPFEQQELPNDQQQQQQRVSHTPQPRPLAKKAEVKPDAKGNLVNAKGEIVARAGSEARIYQGRQKAQRDLAAAQAANQDVTTRLSRAIEIGRGLHTELQGIRAQQQQLKEFGFTPEDQIGAMQLFSELRKNPGATIQKLLTRAAANGITVGTVGNAPGALDSKGIADAIKEVLGAELKPIREQQQAQQQEQQRIQQEQQQRNEIQEEVNTFFTRNPDAQEFLPVFKRVMADPKYSGLSLGEIYARIIRANANRPQPKVNGRQQPSSRTPRRGSPPNGQGFAPQNGSQMASVDQSYDAILKDVLTSAGYNR